MARQKIYERRVVHLPDELAEAYGSMEESWAKGDEETNVAAVRWQWLRQLASGFQDEKLVWSGKVEAVLDLLQTELAHDKVVVWCDYNAAVYALLKACNERQVGSMTITGAEDLGRRQWIVNRFMEQDNPRVLILQQAIAQTGMDLSVADAAIYYTCPPGQMARVQTEDRILNLRKTTPLLYIDMVTANTVDEDVLLLMHSKKAHSQHSLTAALREAMRRRLQWTSV